MRGEVIFDICGDDALDPAALLQLLDFRVERRQDNDCFRLHLAQRKFQLGGSVQRINRADNRPGFPGAELSNNCLR